MSTKPGELQYDETDLSSASYLYQNWPGTGHGAGVTLSTGSYNIANYDTAPPSPTHCYHKFCLQLGNVPSTKIMQALVDDQEYTTGYGPVMSKPAFVDMDVPVRRWTGTRVARRRAAAARYSTSKSAGGAAITGGFHRSGSSSRRSASSTPSILSSTSVR